VAGRSGSTSPPLHDASRSDTHLSAPGGGPDDNEQPDQTVRALARRAPKGGKPLHYRKVLFDPDFEQAASDDLRNAYRTD
jgi:hypothetical protein